MTTHDAAVTPDLLGAADVAEVASAFFQHYRLGDGDRKARLAAQGQAWAWEFVYDAVRHARANLLPLLDALVEVPEADSAYLAYLGGGPLEDLLNDDAARWDGAIAERCRHSAPWREAVFGVDIDLQQHESLRALLPYVRRLPNE